MRHRDGRANQGRTSYTLAALLGARRHNPSAPPGCPPPATVHEVHDRYLLEIVEGLGLCPFARRSREQGRVHRPLLYGTPSATDTATSVRQLLGEHRDAEIVLVTFVDVNNETRWPRARAFDRYVKDVREHYDTLGGPTFFMVGFHRRSGVPDEGETPPRLTPDSLVPILRRTPDPVIQCVSAAVLERARHQAQQAAHAKLLAEAKDPRLIALLERSVQPDSTLSADIARRNFENVAADEGRARLEALIADIAADRDRAYAPWWKPAAGPQ